jgi:hypothetical protein
LLLRYLGRLRFPYLLPLAALLLLVNLVLPDPIPLVDEVLLGIATLLLASWRKREPPEAGGWES